MRVLVLVSCREMFMPRVELILTEFLFLTELTEFFRQRLKDRWLSINKNNLRLNLWKFTFNKKIIYVLIYVQKQPIIQKKSLSLQGIVFYCKK